MFCRKLIDDNMLTSCFLNKLLNGCRMRCDLTDHVERQVYFIGLYEPVESLLLTRLLKPGMTVIDGGANIGQHTLTAAKAVSTGGAVHSFEPIPTTFDKLRGNIELSRLTNVHANRSALWNETTTVRLGLPATTTHNAGTFGIDMGDSVSEVEADATSLDEYVRDHDIDNVDLVKLDVEGAELAALQGMRRVLRRDHPALLVEICRKTAARLGYDVQDIWELLVDDLGYRGWAVGPWEDGAGTLADLKGITQQNVLFYDEGRMSPPAMPNLKAILEWVWSSTRDSSLRHS